MEKAVSNGASSRNPFGAISNRSMVNGVAETGMMMYKSGASWKGLRSWTRQKQRDKRLPFDNGSLSIELRFSVKRGSLKIIAQMPQTPIKIG